MKRLGCAIALLLLLLIPISACAQVRLLKFVPGARALALGKTGVVGLYDPSALFWNPASLAAVHANQMLIAIHQPFLLNYAGYAHYFPLRGTFAIQSARTDPSSEAVEFGGFGWGCALSNSFNLGIALNALWIERESWAAAGVGLLYKPTQRDDAASSFFSSLVADRLAAGLCVQNVPIITTGYDHQIRLGVSYALLPDKIGMAYAYHFQREFESSHFSMTIQPLSGMQIIGGLADFMAKQSFVGIEILWENLTTNLTFDFQEERIAFSTIFRLGASGKDLAVKEYKKAREMLSESDKRKALYQAQKALAYDAENLPAKELAAILAPKIEVENEQIDSLLSAARVMEKRRWYILAAANYLKVLRFDADNRRAKSAMSLINPKLNIHTERWYEIGVRYFEGGEIAHAKEIFESILLVRREHAPSKAYLNRINEILQSQAEEHYFTGLGFYSQHNLGRAEKEFQKALDLVADYADALEYLNRIKQDRQKNYRRIAQLLMEAKKYEESGLIAEALKTYEQIIEIDPNHSVKKGKIPDLRKKVDALVAQNFSRGEAAYSRRDFNAARRAFRAVLELNPDHTGALRYLGMITESRTDKTQKYLALARQYYNEGQWEPALAALDSLAAQNLNSAEANQLRNRINSALGVERILEKAKSEMLSGNYMEAQQYFSDVLAMAPNNAEAGGLRQQCQARLNEQVDECFNRGIQLYTEEKYRSAIAEWEKALRINPNHQGSLEYKRKAEERLEALNQLP